MIEAAVTATKSLDDKALADWLKKNRVDTIQGKLRFDGPSNYSAHDLCAIKQVQNGKWVVVWPKRVGRARREAAVGASAVAKPRRCSASRCCRASSSARCTGCSASG